MTEFIDLFIQHCPIFYFYKKEPYMPCNFDEILKISGIQPPNKVTEESIKMITIPKEKRFNVNIATQILCKSSKIFTVKDTRYLDLIYIVTFTWNGTIEEHAFDKEEVIVRVKYNDDNTTTIFRVYGSAHGDGMWFDRKYLEFNEDGKLIMYSANQSHAMYNRSRTYKRIFGFGNDLTGKYIKWEPSEFVIINDNNVNIYDKNIIEKSGDFKYFLVNKYIGNSKNNQQWPGSLNYDTLNLDAFYKYQGGVDNVFTGPLAQISKGVRIALRVITILVWFGFFGYIIFRDVLNYKNHNYSMKKLVLFIVLHIFLVIGLFITGTILGLDVFILNPIGSP